MGATTRSGGPVALYSGDRPARRAPHDVGIDCQGDRVEWQCVGFGKEYKRYVIDYGVIPSHISDPNCRRNLNLLKHRRWINEYGTISALTSPPSTATPGLKTCGTSPASMPPTRLIMVRGRGDAPRLAWRG